MAKYKTVNVEIPVELIREINYNDKVTREPLTFYKVEIPDGGLEGWEFSPKFVNASKSGKPDLRSCPLIVDRPVKMTRPQRDEDGSILRDENDKVVREIMEVPADTIRQYFEDLAERNWHPLESEDIPF